MIKSVCWIWKPLSWTGSNVAKKQRGMLVSLCSCFLRFVFSSPHCPRPPPLPTQQGHTVRWQKTPQTQQVAGPLLERWAKPVASSVTPGTPFSKRVRRYFQASLEVPGDRARCLYCVHVCAPCQGRPARGGRLGEDGAPGHSQGRTTRPPHNSPIIRGGWENCFLPPGGGDSHWCCADLWTGIGNWNAV